MQRARVPRSEEDEGRIDGGDEPEQHVDQIDPHGVLHAELVVLLGRWVGVDIDLAKGAEERGPEDAIRKRMSVATTFEVD